MNTFNAKDILGRQGEEVVYDWNEKERGVKLRFYHRFQVLVDAVF